MPPRSLPRRLSPPCNPARFLGGLARTHRPRVRIPAIYHGDHINQFLEGDADYEEPVFIFNGTNAQTPFSGSNADDNRRNGTQSFVYVYTSRFWRQALGYSGVLTHEVGHHLGLSHPHDGYDSESGRNLWPRNRFYFIWTGDLVNSVMSYQQTETRDFGQFDQDNMHRWLTAGYLNEANRVLGMIAASPRAAAVDAAVASKIIDTFDDIERNYPRRGLQR